MIPIEINSVEDLVTNESFLNYYFQKNENDVLDWEDWQELDASRPQLVQEAFQLIDRLSLKFNDAHNKVKLQELLWELEKRTQKPQKSLFVRFSNSYLKIAAAVAFMIVSTWFFYSKSTQNVAHTEGGGIALTTQYVVNKSIAKVSVYELSDGTIVRLNSGSSIRLADDYNIMSRDIYLEGEGYFEVAKNTEKPFRVHAGKSITTAVGTAFTVRAIKGESAVKIVLVEGKVKVENINQKLLLVELVAGQQVQVLDAALTPVETLTDVNSATRWKDGYVFTFRETGFEDVMKILATNYKITIIGFEKTDLVNAKITAEFDKATPIASVMEGMAFANGFTFTERNDTFFIVKK